jgi:MFS transporter, FHS family, L-fucose permease
MIPVLYQNMRNCIMNTSSKNNYLLPITIIGVLFFVLGFAIGINTYLIPFLREVFNLSVAASYLVMAATFSSVVIFGFPSGMIIKKIGYKGGIVAAFAVMATGMLLFVPSANTASFPFFLLALFISGAGQVLLQTSVNPYITLLGPQESAAARICFMGISNKVAYALGPIVLSAFLSLEQIDVKDIVDPFFVIAGIFFAGAVFSLFAPLPEIEPAGSEQAAGSKVKNDSVRNYPHLLLGTLAIFFYIGAETLSLGSVLDYGSQSGLSEFRVLGINLHAPELFVTYATLSMIIGYTLGIILIPKYLSQQKALMVSALAGALITLLVLFVPVPLSVWLVAVLGIANAVMWPAIWPLSLADLGDMTKTGSSILITGLVGGVIIPLIFGWLVDMMSYQSAYLICLPCYAYIFYFAVKGHTIRKTSNQTI